MGAISRHNLSPHTKLSWRQAAPAPSQPGSSQVLFLLDFVSVEESLLPKNFLLRLVSETVKKTSSAAFFRSDPKTHFCESGVFFAPVIFYD